MSRLTALFVTFFVLICASVAAAQSPLDRLIAATPQSVDDCTGGMVQRLAVAAGDVEQWAADKAWRELRQSPEQTLALTTDLVKTKKAVDEKLSALMQLRTQFVEMPAGERRRAALRSYLQAASTLIDLSGRMRYLLRDAIDGAAYDLEVQPGGLEKLIDMLTEQRVSIGAVTLAYALFDPEAGSEAEPFPDSTKQKVLRLIAAAGELESLDDLAAFVREPGVSAELLVEAAEAIRHIGLPQDPRPGQNPDLPEPSITAGELAKILAIADTGAISADVQRRRSDLLAWLAERDAKGVSGETFRVGGIDVRSGDWLLMRNPSPYNLFTDLSPGLFTHVGVVAMETGEDGKRRCILVDLPERGAEIPAANIDIYLLRTLHFSFVRHKDPSVGDAMGEAARQMIGNPTQFDLTFRTSRVTQMQGKPLQGAVINTYCAGFLLLCAQQTTAPRDEFFPIREQAAGGKCAANLAQLGVSIGDDFVSPTGAIFSPRLDVVGMRDAMYTPDREIKEAIYDHFANQMVESELTRSPTVAQALREGVAGIAKYNPLLARALARANNVSEKMDLESAARVGAVVESLDEIADGRMNDFFAARSALLAGPAQALQESGLSAERMNQINDYRSRHAELYKQWAANRLSPRQLRTSLVQYYVQQGKSQINARFFPADSGSQP